MAKPKVFCDDNIVLSLKYVSTELEMLGYPEISYIEQNEKQVLLKLINTTWGLISEIKGLLLKHNEQTVELTKLKSQVTSHLIDKSRFEKLVNKERNSFSSLHESLTKVLSQKMNLDVELKKTKLDLKNVKKSMNNLNLQFGNEILRKNNIIANLKDKLARFVNEDYDTEEIFTLSQFFPITEKYPKLDKYLALLSNNIHMLILENASIRNLFIKILLQISNKCGFKNNNDDNELIHYLLNLPEEGFIEKIEEKFNSILNVLKTGC